MIEWILIRLIIGHELNVVGNSRETRVVVTRLIKGSCRAIDLYAFHEAINATDT